MVRSARSNEADLSLLSPREREAVELMLRGMSSQDAARAMGVKDSTVRNHCHRAYAKLGVASLGELRAALGRSATLEDSLPFQPDDTAVDGSERKADPAGSMSGERGREDARAGARGLTSFSLLAWVATVALLIPWGGAFGGEERLVAFGFALAGAAGVLGLFVYRCGLLPRGKKASGLCGRLGARLSCGCMPAVPPLVAVVMFRALQVAKGWLFAWGVPGFDLLAWLVSLSALVAGVMVAVSIAGAVGCSAEWNTERSLGLPCLACGAAGFGVAWSELASASFPDQSVHVVPVCLGFLLVAGVTCVAYVWFAGGERERLILVDAILLMLLAVLLGFVSQGILCCAFFMLLMCAGLLPSQFRGDARWAVVWGLSAGIAADTAIRGAVMGMLEHSYRAPFAFAFTTVSVAAGYVFGIMFTVCASAAIIAARFFYGEQRAELAVVALEGVPLERQRSYLAYRGLNATQVEVALMTARGASRSEISVELCIAPGTVNSARRTAYQLLGVTSRSELLTVLVECVSKPGIQLGLQKSPAPVDNA